MTYKIKYRKFLFWKTETIIGHKYDKELDRLHIFYLDGSLKEIASWSKCDVMLGRDWLDACKKFMEKESGQSIPVNR